MNIDVTGPYVYFVIPVFGGIPVTQTMVSSLIVTILLCTAFILLGKNLQKRPGKMQVLVEKGVTMITDLTASAMGKHNVHWTPFMGCLFLCSICGSYIGLTGFLRPATADINCTATWAIMVSVIIWSNNIKKDGVGKFLKNYLNPMNIISDLSQPLSMSFRHFSNVSVGSIISTILYAALAMLSSVLVGLVSRNGWIIGCVVTAVGILLAVLWAGRSKKILRWIVAIITMAMGLFGLLEGLGILSGVPIFSYGIPGVLSLYFDLFSGFIQALVFTMLSMVYIAGSLPGPEDANVE
jgi:F-type H+-transporting ATPase subunit a